MARLPVIARYAIRVRRNDRVVIDQLTNWKRLSITKRFNAPSDWALELDWRDPLAQLIMTAGYGVQVERRLYSTITGKLLTSYIEIAGPAIAMNPQYGDYALTIKGRDDMHYLAGIEAWPDTTYSYPTFITSKAPQHWYKLNETSGTNAADSGAGPANAGTYSGTFLLNQATVVDDGGKAVHLDGSTAHVGIGSVQTSGYAGATIIAWINPDVVSVSGNPRLYNSAHSDVDNKGIQLLINSSGGNYTTIQGTIGTGAAHTSVTSASGLVTKGVWTMIALTYDGANLRLYKDGVLIAGPTAVTGSLGTPAVNPDIGRGTGGSDFFPGVIDEVIVDNEGWSAADILNAYNYGISRFTAQAYDVRNTVAETAMRGYVNANAVSGQPSNDLLGLSRVFSGLVLETDLGRGASVQGNMRFDQLVNKDGTGALQALAAQSEANGAPIGFTLVPSGTNLSFHVYLPTDRSATVRFSQDLNNLIDWDYSVAAPDPLQDQGNVVIVAGGGEGVERVFVEVQDAASVAQWGRIETFVDARDVSDTPTMTARGQEKLDSSSTQTSFSAVLAQAKDSVYGLDFFVGDKVAVFVLGQSFTDLVREVDIDVSPGQPEKVTPIVGDPGSDFVLSAEARLRRDNSLTQGRITRLEKRR